MTEIFKTLVKSFAHPSAYFTAAFKWKWRAAAYFLLLSGICALSIGVISARVSIEFYDDNRKPALPDIMKMDIADGKVKTPDGRDIELKDKNGRAFALISENYADPNIRKNHLMLLEKDRLAIIMPDGSEMYSPLDGMTPEYKKMFFEFMDSAAYKPTAVLFSFIMALAIAMAMMLMQSLVLGVAAMIFTITMVPRLSFFQCCKLALVSMSPPIIIDFFLAVFMNTLMPSFVFSLLSCGLIMYAVTSFRRGKVETV